MSWYFSGIYSSGFASWKTLWGRLSLQPWACCHSLLRALLRACPEPSQSALFGKGSGHQDLSLWILWDFLLPKTKERSNPINVCFSGSVGFFICYCFGNFFCVPAQGYALDIPRWARRMSMPSWILENLRFSFLSEFFTGSTALAFSVFFFLLHQEDWPKLSPWGLPPKD